MVDRSDRGVCNPADGLARDPDERQGETSYHAEKSVTSEQVANRIELTTIFCVSVRRTALGRQRITVNKLDQLIPMRNRLRVFIFSLTCFSTLCVIAQERANRALEPGHEIIWDLADLDAIKDPSSVRILQVYGVSDEKEIIDDKSLEKLDRFPELRTLVLGCPHMTDQGLKHIAKLKHLECLIIFQCEITDSGIQELKALSKLQTVGLHGTDVTEEGIAKLKMALPKPYFELAAFGTSGQIFDANGCLRTRFAERHLKVKQSGAK